MTIHTIDTLINFLFRTHTRRAGTGISYKEESEDEETGSDEVTEVNWDESAQTQTAGETDTADTIEKVLAQRRGKKGGKIKKLF